MTNFGYRALAAAAVLLLHVAVIFFNVAALAVIPLGAWRGWSFVRIRWWRLLHLMLMATVAVQAYLGRACFLTYWEAALGGNAGEAQTTMPLIQRWISAVIYWPLPLWVFAVIYSAALIYTIALWRLVPPGRGTRAR